MKERISQLLTSIHFQWSIIDYFLFIWAPKIWDEMIPWYSISYERHFIWKIRVKKLFQIQWIFYFHKNKVGWKNYSLIVSINDSSSSIYWKTLKNTLRNNGKWKNCELLEENLERRRGRGNRWSDHRNRLGRKDRVFFKNISFDWCW